ncbi:MAG: 4-hydroxy-tetrahydrodipicolinate reductase [Planctomycetota bacterium]|nr:4-hydroxy-tetrahydrodipicolinate reductase [Planctomycetaceae bacterium]MDQ3330105.1 4-hydroxy-tetrahydrodipicolinate reductase [Planctomycetota bacterium]
MSEDRLRVAVNGAAGRMGQRVIAGCSQDPSLKLVAAIESPRSQALGLDAGEKAGVGTLELPIRSDLGDDAQVVIDFSVPAGLATIADACRQRKVALVAATTGLTEEQKSLVRDTAKVVPVVFAPSMSLAVNVAMKLVRDAARAMKSAPGGVDVEVIERHHRFKEDAPSGTALHFGRIVADEMGQTDHVHGRSGRPGERPRNEIGYHALRTGDNVGEHTIVFGLLGETLEVSVRSHTRDSYALGAIAAAKWVVSQPPGLYGMADVLGL